MASDSAVRAGTCAMRSPAILDWLAADEAPEVGVESRFFCSGEKRLRVLDGGRDFQPVAHDPGVAEQSLYVTRAVAGDLLRAKAIKSLSVVLRAFSKW